MFCLQPLYSDADADECATCTSDTDTEILIDGCETYWSVVSSKLPPIKRSDNSVPANIAVYYCEGNVFNTFNRKLAETALFESGKTYTVRTEVYQEGEEQLEINLQCTCDQTFSVWKKSQCPSTPLALTMYTATAGNDELKTEIKNLNYYTKDASTCAYAPEVNIPDSHSYTHNDTHSGCENNPQSFSYQLLSPHDSILATCNATVSVFHPELTCPAETLKLEVNDKEEVLITDLPAYVKQGVYYADACSYGLSAPEVSIASADHYNFINTHTGTEFNDCSKATDAPASFIYNIVNTANEVVASCPATIIVTKEGSCQNETCGSFISYNITNDVSIPGTDSELFPVLEGIPYGNNKTTEFVGRYTEQPIFTRINHNFFRSITVSC